MKKIFRMGPLTLASMGKIYKAFVIENNALFIDKILKTVM